MARLVHRLVLCGSLVLGTALASATAASAEVAVPFQIEPAPYGNPRGSVDSPPSNCVVVVGEQPGTARVDDAVGKNTGCYLISEVRWVNVSTGASGVARLGEGVPESPRGAIVNSGPGQVALIGIPYSVTTVPGFALVEVP